MNRSPSITNHVSEPETASLAQACHDFLAGELDATACDQFASELARSPELAAMLAREATLLGCLANEPTGWSPVGATEVERNLPATRLVRRRWAAGRDLLAWAIAAAAAVMLVTTLGRSTAPPPSDETLQIAQAWLQTTAESKSLNLISSERVAVTWGDAETQAVDETDSLLSDSFGDDSFDGDSFGWIYVAVADAEAHLPREPSDG